MTKQITTRFLQDFGYLEPDQRALREQTTGDLFICDIADWEKARHCLWFFDKNKRLVNKAGVTFEAYVGIKTPRKVPGIRSLNYSRSQYH